jgi:hypothetical protein
LRSWSEDKCVKFKSSYYEFWSITESDEHLGYNYEHQFVCDMYTVVF